MNKSWTIQKQVMNKWWTSDEQVVNEKEQVVNKLWTSNEQVEIATWTQNYYPGWVVGGWVQLSCEINAISAPSWALAWAWAELGNIIGYSN